MLQKLWLVGVLALLGTAVLVAQESNDDINLPIDETVTYEIRRGDTLDTLGALFDVAPRCLAQENDIAAGEALRIGDELTISAECPVYGAPRTAPPIQVRFPRAVPDNVRATLGQGGGGTIPDTYTVLPGDTLDTIAQAFDVSIVSLQMVNDLERPSELEIGAELVIPDDAPAYGGFPAIETPFAGMLYSVEVGETLDDIAQAFDVQLAALETVNSISSGRNALPGTMIVIPDDAPPYGSDEVYDAPAALGQGGGATGETIVVQPRTTVDSIAAVYNVDTACLLESNDITNPRVLQPGTVLVIDESCPEYTGFDNSPQLRNPLGIEPFEEPADDADTTDENTESDEGEAVPLGERG